MKACGALQLAANAELAWHRLRIWRVADKTCNGVLNEMAMSMAKLLQKHQTRVTLDLQSENAHKLYRLK
jgi:hypothetical protein